MSSPMNKSKDRSFDASTIESDCQPTKEQEHAITTRKDVHDFVNAKKDTPSSEQVSSSPSSPYCTRACSLSLTCVALAVPTLVIVIVVAVVLAVSVSYSLSAAEEFAESYSEMNIVAATSRVNDFVKIPVNAFTEIKKMADFGYLSALPTNASGAFTTDEALNQGRQVGYMNWLGRFHPMLFSGEFELLYVAIGLKDKSWVSCNRIDVTTWAHQCTYINYVNATEFGLSGNGFEYYDNYDPNATSWSGQGPPTFTRTVFTDNAWYDPTERPWYMEAPKGVGASPIFSQVYIDSDMGIPIVDVNGPIHDSNGNLLGVTSISLALAKISEFVSQIPHTASSLTVLVDGDGLLVGASDRGSLTISTPYAYATHGPISDPACEEYYNEVANTTSKVCRLKPSTYSNPKLAELAASHPDLFAQDGASFTRSVTIDGERWMLSKAPISARTDITDAAITWQMYTMMPVSDVTGQIVKGRNVGIIIACVMVVVSCGACGVALYTLLHPLSGLADMMERASELRDDSLGASIDKSRMREIRTIQDAFERLSAQLKRAKSFLPASLLAQLESTDDEEGGEREMDEGHVSEQDGRRHAASDQTSGTSTVRRPGTTRTSWGAARRQFDSRSRQDDSTYETTVAGGHLKVIGSHVSLTQRSLSVAVLNLRGFHRAASASPSMLEAGYGPLIDAYQSVAKECKGILDSFHGDRFYFTFNAVKPCGAHAGMAATAMLKATRLHAQRAQDWDGASPSVAALSVSAGVATGRCLVGNLGSERAKRFTVIGPAFSQATVLERLCKRYPAGTSVLLSHETALECEAQVGLLYVDVITPVRASGKVAPIAAAMYVRNGTSASDEWMYEMAQASSTCDYNRGNNAFRAALAGDASTARAELAAFTDASPQSSWARARIAELLECGVQPAALGEYFDVCIGQSGMDAKCDGSVSVLVKHHAE